MRKLLSAATALAAMTWIASVSAAPVEMTDAQLTAVTAGGGEFHGNKHGDKFVKIINTAVAFNIANIDVDSSTSTSCKVGCPAVSVNIVKLIQNATATAGGK